jgi:AhpD family alkylhydroperoxidase
VKLLVADGTEQYVEYRENGGDTRLMAFRLAQLQRVSQTIMSITQALDDDLLLALEMSIQRRFRYSGDGYDLVDAHCAEALLVEQRICDLDDVAAIGHSRLLSRVGMNPELPGQPADVGHIQHLVNSFDNAGTNVDIGRNRDYQRKRQTCLSLSLIWMETMLGWKNYRGELGTRIGRLRELVPDMMKGYAALAASGEKATHLDGKTRELIALAVAVTTRCDGCIAGHVEAAIKFGASEKEVAEALGVAIALNSGAALVYSARVLDCYAEMSAS